MSVILELNEEIPLQPKLDLVGNDELKDELELFLTKGMNSLNGFNVYYLSEYVFDSEFGHHRWDFTFKDERPYNSKDWDSLVSLNFAWDCWLIGRDIREF